MQRGHDPVGEQQQEQLSEEAVMDEVLAKKKEHEEINCVNHSDSSTSTAESSSLSEDHFAQDEEQEPPSTTAETQQNFHEEHHCCSHDNNCAHKHEDFHSNSGISKNLLAVTSPSPSLIKEQSSIDQIAFVQNLSDLSSKVHSDAIQLAVWRHTKAPSFIDTLSDVSLDLTPDDLPSFEGLVFPHRVEELLKNQWKKDKNNAKENRSTKTGSSRIDDDTITQMAKHIQLLAQAFAHISKSEGYYVNENDGTHVLGQEEAAPLPLLHLKLKVVSHNCCKYWHRDSVPLRLVATYRGPCTEFIPPIHGGETSSLKKRRLDSKHAQSLTHCDVALFKGTKACSLGKHSPNDGGGDSDYEDNKEFGIVHRSPHVEGGGVHRLVLVIDVPQKGWHYE